MQRIRLAACGLVMGLVLSVNVQASLLGDTLNVTAHASGFVTFIDGSALVVDPGVEFPAPSLAPNLDVVADFAAASLGLTITRPAGFGSLLLPNGVEFFITGVDAAIQGVTYTGGSLLVDELVFDDHSISFRTKAPGDLFVTAAPFDGQFQILTIPEPQTYALLLAGLGLLGFAARRRGARA
jgi:hypothetical protein